MELESSCSTAVTLEMVISQTSQALIVETALIVEKCLGLILLAISSFRSDVLPNTIQEKESFSRSLVCIVVAENDDGGEPANDAGEEPISVNGYEEDQMSDDGAGNSEASGGDDEGDGDAEMGSNDGDDGEEDDDDDDDDDDDEDHSEYDPDDEDGEEDDKHKYCVTCNAKLTDSESDEDGPGYGSLLKHAREVYKPTSFSIFEHECNKSRTIFLDVSDEGWGKDEFVIEYVAEKIGHHFKKHTVTAWPTEGIIKCSCKYFDVAGILCCHAITVLGCLRIEKIPEHYILQRHVNNADAGLGAEEHYCPMPDFGHQCRPSGTSAKDVLEMNMNLIDAPLLRHARDVYVPDVFLKFQEEYKQSEYVFLSPDRETHDEREIVLDGKVIRPGHPKRHRVHAESGVGRVDCSCNGFQKTGILCCHAICVLDSLCIERIPDQYISMASRKDPGHREVRGIHGEKYSELARFSRRKATAPLVEELVQLASQSEECTKFLAEWIDKGVAILQDLVKDDEGNNKEIGLESDQSLDEIYLDRKSCVQMVQQKLEASCSTNGTLVQDKNHRVVDSNVSQDKNDSS